MTSPPILLEAIRDARSSWRTLAATDLVYKLAAFAVLTPATIGLLHWAMSRAGASVVADTEIATFFLTTRQGLLALLICGAMLIAITALELTCLMVIGVAALSGERQTVRGALAFGAARAVPVLRLALNVVARALVGVLPFAAAIGLVYWTLLRDHDINFYLSTRPPEFITALVLAALIVIALIVVLVRTIARWSLALPLVLFEQVSPRRALGESSRRSVPLRRPALWALGGWAILAAALLTVAAWVPQVVGRSLAPVFAGSVEQLIVFIAVWAMLYAALAVAVAVVNASVLAMVLARVYLRSRSTAVPAYARASAVGPAFGRYVKIGAALAAILAAAGVALIVVNMTKRNQQVVVIAHRGASAAAPENTLAAFGLAADQRADFVELDVQESADGEIMVVHDSDLMKVGRAALKIWQSTSAELRGVDIGSYKDAKFSGERVPTLAEALALCKGRVRVIVELKTYGHGQRLVERVIDVVEAAGVADQTVFMSLDHDLVRQLKQLRPTWRVGALVAKAMGDLTAIEADFLAVEAGLATRAMVRQAHRAGRDVYVWTVNDPVRMLRAMSNGVDGLITDFPDVARRVVERRSGMSDAQRVLAALLVATGATTERLVAEEALQPYTLAAASALPVTDRLGSPESGAFFSDADRKTAAANAVSGPATGAYLRAQPVQGISSMVPGPDGTWWALADNGYGRRDNSADFQLVIHRLNLRWNDPGGPAVLETVVLRDPDRHLPWALVCDPARGTPLPPLAFNARPPSAPPACGVDAGARILTGFDLDPESFVRAGDGSFWVSEEFGPFLLHVAADGRVLEPPVEIPGVRSPQNPFLHVANRPAAAERPTIASSRGFEGMAISPDGATLYALLEGAVSGDDPRDLRIYRYDLAGRSLAESFLKVRLEAPSQTVDSPGPMAIGELKAVNERQFLLIERDNHGDGETAPAIKKLYLLDLSQADERGGYLAKTQIVDLLKIPDPEDRGGDMHFFRLPFYTIESVHVVDAGTLLVATDNNFPFSNGRARSRSRDRRGPLAADVSEFVLVRLAEPLDVDRRLLPGR